MQVRSPVDAPGGEVTVPSWGKLGGGELDAGEPCYPQIIGQRDACAGSRSSPSTSLATKPHFYLLPFWIFTAKQEEQQLWGGVQAKIFAGAQ